MRSFLFLIMILVAGAKNSAYCQIADSLPASLENIPHKFYGKVEKKYAQIDQNLSRRSVKYLRKLEKQEEKLNRKVGLPDSTRTLLDKNVIDKYDGFIRGITEKAKRKGHTNLNQYNAYVDSLSTSLSFLKKFGDATKTGGPITALDNLKDKLNQSEQISSFIAERKQQIQQVLSNYTKLPTSVTREFSRLNKTAYYYRAQVGEYKSMLKDPKKIEEKALEVLNKMPFFQKFMKENSQLASLFGLPENYGTPASLAGLQTRASVQGMIQQRIAAGGPNAMAQVQQNLQNAQAQLMQLKDRLLKVPSFGGDLGETGIPDFKVNQQKVKAFKQRLVYGFNIQFAKSTSLLPSTSDIAGTVGYKINDKSEAGIGMSYKVGLGTLQHIQLSSQGIGLRSYLDWEAPFGSKIKMLTSLYISGGYEMNYNSAFKNIEELKNEETWQRSALLGLSKQYQVSKKLKGKMQLLYDFLANSHKPVSQPVIFRMGYNF